MLGRISVVLVAIMAAGCVDTQAPLTAPEPPDGASADTVLFHGRACMISAVAMLRSFPETAAWLPPGFHARDASRFIPMDVNLQQSAFVVVTWTCDETSLTQGPLSFVSATVFVEAPTESEGLDPARFDFYEIERFVPDDPHARHLVDMGWATSGLDQAHLGSVFSQAVDVPTLEYRPHPTHMSADATVAGDLLFSATAAGAAHYLVADRIIRFWHVLDDGEMGVMEIVPSDNGAGGSATCQIGSETRLAEIVGAQACVDGATAAASFPEIAWTGHFATLPRTTL